MTTTPAPMQIVARRAQGYAGLPWADDSRLFSALLPSGFLEDAEGVLDLGCGPGYLACWLSSVKPLRYVGVDNSAAMLQQARRSSYTRRDTEFIQADIEKFSSGSYQGWALILANVLHYLSDPAVMITLPRRIGRARTMSIAETECADRGALEWVRELFELACPGYRRRWFARGDVAALACRTGARVVSERELEQRVDLDTWLATWRVSPAAAAAAHSHFDSAPLKTTASLRLETDAWGRRSMARRQCVLLLDLS